MQCKSPLMLKNTPLDVEEMEPLPPPPLMLGPTEPHKLIMTGNAIVTKLELERFLSGPCSDDSDKRGTPIKRLLYGFQYKVILIEFPSMPGTMF